MNSEAVNIFSSKYFIVFEDCKKNYPNNKILVVKINIIDSIYVIMICMKFYSISNCC